MPFTIAIQPDDYRSKGIPDASSPRWAEGLERAGHIVRWVDVYRADILEQVQGCQGFMWRWGHMNGMGQIARRLLPVLERELGMVVYPDQSTCWHFDDKIAQAYLLKALKIPTPTTWVWFDLEAARQWTREATFPVVAKLAGGAGSSNVRLMRTRDEALAWIERMFATGISSVGDTPGMSTKDRLKASAKVLLGRNTVPYELQKNYVLFQEFLDKNPFDTRITVIGKRAFGFRRFNRPNDFRASGSGLIDHDPQQVDLRVVRLALRAARLLQSQSCAVDGLFRGGEPAIGEVSYTFSSKAVHDCPGHWDLEGEPDTGQLVWTDGTMWPEAAQLEDFLTRLVAVHSA